MWRREHVDRRTLGDWSFELRDDEIADLTFRGRPALRSVRAVVRDRNWDTALWTLDRVETTADRLVLRLHTDRLGADLTGALEAVADGDRIRISFDAVSRGRFETNRTGLVVLHPPGMAGSPLRVTHPDGTAEEVRIPRLVSPHQPVRDIAALSEERGDLSLEVRFDGDVFEMEDQRNWSDASFKTYSRPLALPFPYLLEAGERVVQRVTVTARPAGAGGAAPAAVADEIVLGPAGPFPAISLGAATAPDPAPAIDPIGHDVLVELDLASPTWEAALDRAAASALPLDVRFVLDDADPEASLARGVAALAGHDIARVTAFWPTGPARHVSDVAAIALLRDALAAAGRTVPVVGGSRAHFTELNREHHRLPGDLDGVVFGTTPLFHSLDTEQLVEAVPMQRLLATQAVAIAAGPPVLVGPVSLRPHFNDVATTPPPYAASPDLRDGYGPELLGADDDRQAAPELAAWTIASAAALTVPGVAGISFYEEWGPRGIRDRTGAETAAASAVRALAALEGEALVADDVDDTVWAIGCRSADGIETVLVANIGTGSRRLRIRTPARTFGLDLAPGTWTVDTAPLTAPRG